MVDQHPWPPVAVVMVIRDEALHLREAVEAVLAQDYPGPLRVAVAVGPSRDGTEQVAADLAARDPRVTVVANPTGRTPAGLNAAFGATDEPVVVRVDGHAVLPPGYVRRGVELLESTGAVNVGGVMGAEGTTSFERTVAAAMSSPFGVGGSRFHYGGEPGPADTVYLGIFRREAVQAAGGYDESFTRAQDWELNHRLRGQGGLVWFAPELRVTYRPRPSLRALARQYRDYGRWRRVVMRRHSDSVRWHYLVPPAAVLAIVLGLALVLSGHPVGWLAPVGYVAANLVASVLVGRRLPLREALRLPLVLATMHLCWGFGFLTSSRRLGRTVSP
ncbi:MAG TPA: glycosyltransferase family 2 protein [Mycobacteriales bacterium]|nr:glycosyltransferase family 2 protein [Mycobacteriales bacterium]